MGGPAEKIYDKVLKNHVSLLVETSSWLELVTFVKQIQTANICLNVERYYCNFKGKSWTLPGEKSWIRPCVSGSVNTIY